MQANKAKSDQSSFSPPRSPVRDTPLLLQAAENGDIHAVRKLLKAGTSVDIQDEETGNTPLILASKHGHSDVVRLLLRHRADANKQAGQGVTALMVASESGYSDIVSFLVKHCQINTHNNTRDTSLMLACANGCQSVVNILLDHKANIQAKNHTGNTALLAACGQPNVQIVKALIERGADVAGKNVYGCTPLMTASSAGYVQIVKYLLDKGADVNAKNFLHNTAFSLAATSLASELGVLKMLVKNGADFHVKNHTRTPLLLQVIDRENLNVVKYLISLGVDVNEPDEDGQTPLMHAVSQSHLDVVDFLLRKGCNVDQTDSNGQTALDKLFSRLTQRKGGIDFKEKRDMAVKLLRAGATVGDTTTGSFFLQKMIRLDDRVVVQLMIQRGASPTAVPSYYDPSPASPLFTALRNGRADTSIARFFLSNWFLSHFDVVTLSRDPQYRNCRFLLGECRKIVRNLYAQPWSLTCLCFITVSETVGHHRGREERVAQLDLPVMIKEQLLHQDDAAKIPISKWKTLMFSV